MAKDERAAVKVGAVVRDNWRSIPYRDLTLAERELFNTEHARSSLRRATCMAAEEDGVISERPSLDMREFPPSAQRTYQSVAVRDAGSSDRILALLEEQNGLFRQLIERLDKAMADEEPKKKDAFPARTMRAMMGGWDPDR